MIPISASPNTYKPSFGKGTIVRYVVLNGHSEADPKVVEEVTAHFVKQIQKGRPEDAALRRALHQATGDSSLAEAYQAIKRIGKRLITGQDAAELQKIWSKAMALVKKKQEAANLVSRVFHSAPVQKIVLVAEKIDVKGKMKYIVKNLYTTIY